MTPSPMYMRTNLALYDTAEPGAAVLFGRTGSSTNMLAAHTVGDGPADFRRLAVGAPKAVLPQWADTRLILCVAHKPVFERVLWMPQDRVTTDEIRCVTPLDWEWVIWDIVPFVRLQPLEHFVVRVQALPERTTPTDSIRVVLTGYKLVPTH